MAQSKTVTLKMGIDIRRAKTGSEAYSRLLLKMAQDTARANRAMTGLGGAADKTAKQKEELAAKSKSATKQQQLYTQAMKAGIFATQGFANSAITAVATIASIGPALAGVAIAVGKMQQAVAAAAESFADFEKRAGAVQRVAGVTGTEARELGQAFRDIGKEIPVAATALADIGQEVARLGVRGTENIARFTKTVAMLAEVSDLSGPQAATQLGRIVQIASDIGVQDVGKFADSLRAAATSAAASESEILRTTLEITKAGLAFDLPAKFALSLATAMREAGVQAELSRSAIVTVLNEVGLALGGNVEKLNAWTSGLGLTITELDELVKTDIEGFFDLFLTKVREANEQGRLAPFLLGFDESFVSKRVLPTLAATASNLDKVRSSSALVNEQFAGGSRLTKDFAGRVEELDAKNKLLTEAMTELRRRGFEGASEAQGDFVSALTLAVKRLSESESAMNRLSTAYRGFIGLKEFAVGSAVGFALALDDLASSAEAVFRVIISRSKEAEDSIRDTFLLGGPLGFLERLIEGKGFSEALFDTEGVKAFAQESAGLTDVLTNLFRVSPDEVVSSAFITDLTEAYKKAGFASAKEFAEAYERAYAESGFALSAKEVLSSLGIDAESLGTVAQQEAFRVGAVIAEGITEGALTGAGGEGALDAAVQAILKKIRQAAPKELSLFPGAESVIESIKLLETGGPEAQAQVAIVQAEAREAFGGLLTKQIKAFQDGIASEGLLSEEAAKDKFRQIEQFAKVIGGEFEDQIPVLRELLTTYLEFLQSPEFIMRNVDQMLGRVREFGGTAGQIQSLLTRFAEEVPLGERTVEIEARFRRGVEERFGPKVTRQVEDYFAAIERGGLTLEKLNRLEEEAIFSLSFAGGADAAERQRRVREAAVRERAKIAAGPAPAITATVDDDKDPLRPLTRLLQRATPVSEGILGEVERFMMDVDRIIRENADITQADADRLINLEDLFGQQAREDVRQFALSLEDGSASFLTVVRDAELLRAALIKINPEFKDQGDLLLRNARLYEEMGKKFADPVVAESMNIATQSLRNFASTLADSLVEGEFNFESFADSILKSVLEMILRLQVLLPLFEALRGQGGVLGQAGNLLAQSLGGLAPGSLTPAPSGIATGGSPLMIGSPSGNPVLEGRGPRMSSGPVNVTVNNAPAGTQAQSRQQQRQGPDGMEMDIIIDLVDAKLAERAGNGRSALGSMLSAQAQQRGLT